MRQRREPDPQQFFMNPDPGFQNFMILYPDEMKVYS